MMPLSHGWRRGLPAAAPPGSRLGMTVPLLTHF